MNSWLTPLTISNYTDSRNPFGREESIMTASTRNSNENSLDSMGVKPERLTSDIFGVDAPPQDLADVALLIPHEALRREMAAFAESLDAVPDSTTKKDGWKVLYLCHWFVNHFYNWLHSHHDSEEDIYFPWAETRIKLPHKRELSHHLLIKSLGFLKESAESIIAKDGLDCEEDIANLRKQWPSFAKAVKDHFTEEELVIPELVRTNFTEEEQKVAVRKLLRSGGLRVAKGFLPCLFIAMRDWATDDFQEQFLGFLSPPIRYLIVSYYIPNYETSIAPLRDAPLLEEMPSLSNTPCCRMPGCFACII